MKTHRLDIRPLLARGEEPFSAIMALVAACTAWNALGIRRVGQGSEVMGFLLLAPFAAVIVLGAAMVVGAPPLFCSVRVPTRPVTVPPTVYVPAAQLMTMLLTSEPPTVKVTSFWTFAAPTPPITYGSNCVVVGNR